MPLTNVLWIGGPPGSGKTSVAEWFATTHGLRYWGADKFAQIHHRRAIEQRVPAVLRWQAMTHDQRWLGEPANMAELSLEISGGRGAMIVEDLRREPANRAIVAEGTPLRPEVIRDVLATPGHALWLVPTPGAEERNLRERGGTSHALTSDPPRAESNRIAREVLVARHITREAERSRFNVLVIDEAMTLDDVKAAVAGYFAPVLADLPLARTGDDRRKLRRAENVALLEHLKDFLEEVPTVGTLDTFSARFVCECGQACEIEHLELSPASFEAVVATGRPLLAPGHPAQD